MVGEFVRKEWNEKRENVLATICKADRNDDEWNDEQRHKIED